MNYKIVSDLLRHIANPSEYQISVQYPAQSIEQSWKNGEVIINAFATNQVTLIVFSSNDANFDQKICSKILEVNSDIRLILVSNILIENYKQILKTHSGKIIILLPETHAKDTALTLLRLANAASFMENASFISAFKDRMTQIGFKDLLTQSNEVLQFVTTAAQSQDKEEKLLDASWKAYICKTIYPVLRDLSDFRGIILQGQLFDSSFTAYKESRVNFVTEDLDRISSLIKTFSTVRLN